MSSRPRLEASDALRALATVGVIVIHAAAWGPANPYAAVQLIARFSVPTFMVLTGVLLAYQYSDRPLGLSFMRRRLGRTLIPWLAWVPVYIVFDMLIGTFQPNAGNFAYMFRTGAGHLWYLLLIPQLYVVFALWPRRLSWSLAMIAIAVQTALCVARLYVVLPGGWPEQIMQTYSFLMFPFWIGYFAVGVALGRALLRRPQPMWPASAAARRIAVLAGVALLAASGYLLLNLSYAGAPGVSFLTGTGAFLNPVMPLFVFAVVLWVAALTPALMRQPATARFMRTLGDLSLGVYIIHPIFLWLIGRLLIGTFTIGAPLSVLPWSVFVLLTLLVAMLATRLLAATSLAITVGMRRAPIGSPRLFQFGRPRAA